MLLTDFVCDVLTNYDYFVCDNLVKSLKSSLRSEKKKIPSTLMILVYFVSCSFFLGTQGKFMYQVYRF